MIKTDNMEKVDKRRKQSRKECERQHWSGLSLRHSSPMAVLMIAAFLNLAASSNLETASLQDLIYNCKAMKMGSVTLAWSSISIMSVMQKILKESEATSTQTVFTVRWLRFTNTYNDKFALLLL